MAGNYYRLPELNNKFIDKKEYFFVFETGLFDKDNFLSYIFFDPIDVIRINRSKDIASAFSRIERYAKTHYLAGYFSYELGYFFQDAAPRFRPGFPLACLCVFEKPACFNHLTGKWDSSSGLFDHSGKKQDFSIKNLRFSLNRGKYIGKVKRIKEYIRRGDTYQVNFSGKFRFDFLGSPIGLYRALRDRQLVPYGAFCRFKKDYIISLSPELFFRLKGGRISSKPMKGTMVRGRDLRQDKEIARSLENSAKNRAENLMIVDLMRNDLGKICRTGSIKVSRLFEIEKYRSLFQMTSTVSGVLRKGVSYYDIFRDIFPGGSVTGAPKIMTMQIIRELEEAPRNIYCGALGLILPGKRAVFNLPIRTISLSGGRGEMGVGSGIVSDSDPGEEFAECLLKARFLTHGTGEFQLLESLLWNGRYALLNEHLIRMKRSAGYFAFAFSRQEVLRALKRAAKEFRPGNSYKVRLLLNRRGRSAIENSRIAKTRRKKEYYVALSRQRTDPESVFYYHKTTHRALYDSEHRHYASLGYLDVLFLNNRQELTEGAISNVIVKKAGKCYTPPVSCGLLPGIFRSLLLKRKEIIEKVLLLDDLLQADAIFLCNSVRGLTEVILKLKNTS